MVGPESTSALSEFVEMMFRPDNVPIVGMLILVLFFTYLGFREARRNDELIAQGREDEILNDMQR
jgi:hypothetical protein